MIQAFLMNLLLAAVYVALTQDTSFLNLVIAFAIGYFVMGVYGRVMGRGSYTIRLLVLIKFVLYFVKILIKSNLLVAWEIITPGYHMTPRIIRYPVEGLTDVQITTLANAITLTPGTLTADVEEDNPDGKALYIHCMYAKDRDAAVADLDELKDRMMREVFGQ